MFSLEQRTLSLQPLSVNFRSHPMHQNQFQSCYEELHPKVQQVTTLRHLSKATRHPLNISKHPETVLKPFLPLHPTFQGEFALELPRISKFIDFVSGVYILITVNLCKLAIRSQSKREGLRMLWLILATDQNGALPSAQSQACSISFVNHKTTNSRNIYIRAW